MYAVIKSGGQQHKAEIGRSFKVNLIKQQPGDVIEISDVLMLSSADAVTLGTPFVSGAKVVLDVIEHGRDKKIKILKFRRRKHHMKRMGHRQWFTLVRVKEIIHGA